MRTWRTTLLGVVIVLLALAIAPGGAPQYVVVHPFTGGAADGSAPEDASVVMDAAGNLYGTTLAGGNGWGTVYKIHKTGTPSIEVLRSFALSEGGRPDATLLLDNGTLYGTTTTGGRFGFGSVFKVNTDSSDFDVLWDFAGGANDGASPSGPLVLDGSGVLYGTTSAGGLSNLGTVSWVNAPVSLARACRCTLFVLSFTYVV